MTDAAHANAFIRQWNGTAPSGVFSGISYRVLFLTTPPARGEKRRTSHAARSDAGGTSRKAQQENQQGNEARACDLDHKVRTIRPLPSPLHWMPLDQRLLGEGASVELTAEHPADGRQPLGRARERRKRNLASVPQKWTASRSTSLD
ncbi:unnamed protein product [Lampetra planeri]